MLLNVHYCLQTSDGVKVLHPHDNAKLDFQVENQPRAAYIGRTALVGVEECVHSVMFLKKQLQA